MSNSVICPIARTTDLTIEELPVETVIYDHKRNRIHCLNQSTSFIWRRCDGKVKIEEIAALLPEVGVPGDLDVVRRALKVLKRAHLLEAGPSFAVSKLPSRRQLVRRLGLAGTTAAVLPTITSTVAPTPAMAKSGDRHTHDKKPKKPKKNHNDLDFFN